MNNVENTSQDFKIGDLVTITWQDVNEPHWVGRVAKISDFTATEVQRGGIRTMASAYKLMIPGKKTYTNPLTNEKVKFRISTLYEILSSIFAYQARDFGVSSDTGYSSQLHARLSNMVDNMGFPLPKPREHHSGGGYKRKKKTKRRPKSRKKHRTKHK